MLTPLDILSIESWLLLATLLALARYYLHRKWQWLKNMNIPHDPPTILNMGHLRQLFSVDGACEFDLEMKKKYGPIWGSYFWTSPVITIHDPGMLRQIFIKDFPSFAIRDSKLTKTGGKELNASFMSTIGDQWKRIRSTMTPTFSTSKLKQMSSIVEWCAENAVNALNRKVQTSDGVFNSKEFFSRLSLDVICSAAFSAQVHTLDDTKKEPEIVQRAKALIMSTSMNIYIFICIIFPPFEKLMERFDITIFPRASVDYFAKLTRGIIEKREGSPHGQNRVDLMQLMLDSKIDESQIREGVEKGMTTNEIVGNSMLMILAGYDNTGATMGYLAYNLAVHTDIQTEVQREIEEMMKTHGKFDHEGLNALKLLDMCLNETLRLYNPVLKNQRLCTKEITIKGLTIPKGAVVFVPSYSLSHDPEYWEDPEEFKPERMRDMSQIDPMVYQPFGAGPRKCIGMRFALMEIKISIAKILRKFSFAPAENTPKPPLKLKFDMLIRPVVDYNLKVISREVK